LNIRGVLEKLRSSELRPEVEEILAQDKLRPTRGKVSTTDHPPIYPVAGATKKDIARKDHWNVYELVVRRFLATLAPASRIATTKVELKIGEEPFVAEGLKVVDPGWRKYYPYYTVREVLIPELQLNERVEVLKVILKEDKTKPPPRYTQASLIQEMERHGLGTKSTRHEIIKKLYERKYVYGSSIIPTHSGIAVSTALEDQAEMITKSEMTAELENEMTEIAEGRKELETVVRDSQKMLSSVLEVLHKNRAKIGEEINIALKKQDYIGKCRKCSTGELTIIRANGRRFIGCSNYPECNNTYAISQVGHIEAVDKECETCGNPMILIRHRHGPETRCVDSNCASVKETNILGSCKRCGSGKLRIITSSKGKRFAGCSNYPNCTNTFPLPQNGMIIPLKIYCPNCGAPRIKVITKGKRPWELCINMECGKEDKRVSGGSKTKTSKNPNASSLP
jgi:DNA topoisomerase-1